jgi:hypothetical protein
LIEESLITTGACELPVSVADLAGAANVAKVAIEHATATINVGVFFMEVSLR